MRENQIEPGALHSQPATAKMTRQSSAPRGAESPGRFQSWRAKRERSKFVPRSGISNGRGRQRTEGSPPRERGGIFHARHSAILEAACA
jgi:hypothetical protein